MSIGLVRNARDSDMIEICGSRGTEWPYVWGIIHGDGIGDAIEGELLTKPRDPFKHLVECVIVSQEEWQQICSDLVEANERIELLQQDLRQFA